MFIVAAIKIYEKEDVAYVSGERKVNRSRAINDITLSVVDFGRRVYEETHVLHA